MNAQQAGQEAIEGVTLEQFAAVNAATAEGFAMNAVLAIEGIAAKAWQTAKIAWLARVTTDASGPLFAKYQEALAAAEDNLAREVKPLEADLGAWLGFLDGFSARGFLLLVEHDLGMNDMARLKRHWSQKMAQDAELEKRALELRRSGFPPLGTLTVGKKELKRFARGAKKPSPTFATPPVASAAVASSALEKAQFCTQTFCPFIG